MRPAHSAREIQRSTRHDKPELFSFNEARAFSAGNLLADVRPQLASEPFNEARAFSAGNHPFAAGREVHTPPSMRPAHSAREISDELAHLNPFMWPLQ